MSMRWLWIALALAGCSGRSCKGDAPAPTKKAKAPAVTTPAVQACLDRLRAVTEYTDRCEGGKAWWGTVERAVEQLRPACEVMAIAPGVTYDRIAIDACIALLPKHPCSTPLPEACGVHGSVANGEPCAFSEQCGRAAFCKPADTPCGVCAPVAKEGDDCGDTQCEESLNCAGSKCVKPRSAGEPCTSEYDCQRMMFCQSGKCLPLRHEGQACTGPECAPSFACASGTCKKRPDPGPPGAKCQSSLDCLDFSCVAGSCSELGGLGEPCDPEKPDLAPCSPSFVCFQGKCTLPDAHACRR